jgi:hypothetical protein
MKGRVRLFDLRYVMLVLKLAAAMRRMQHDLHQRLTVEGHPKSLDVFIAP